MAVRFRCTACRASLSIASRKAGTTIRCPICGAEQIVPGEDQAPADEAPAEAPPALADEGGAIASEALTGDAGLLLDEFALAPETAAPRGRGARTIVVPRSVVYAQAGVILCGVLGGFVAGYLFARSGGKAPPHAAAELPAERALVEGTVRYTAADGRPVADAGALAILLSKEKLPVQPIATAAIAGRAELNENDPSLVAIRAADGDAGLATAAGKFTLVAPKPGEYFLLVVSSRAARPAHELHDEAALLELGRRFAAPVGLLRDRRYRWMPLAVGGAVQPIEITFPAGG